MLLSAPTALLCERLSRQKFFSRYSSERLFPTVATAVAYAKDGHKVVREGAREGGEGGR